MWMGLQVLSSGRYAGRLAHVFVKPDTHNGAFFRGVMYYLYVPVRSNRRPPGMSIPTAPKTYSVAPSYGNPFSMIANPQNWRLDGMRFSYPDATSAALVGGGSLLGAMAVYFGVAANNARMGVL